MANLTGGILRAMMRSAAKEKMRFALQGVRVSPLPEGKGTRLEATDGRMLLRADVETNGAGTGFITPEHVAMMKTKDVVRIEGMDIIVHGAAMVRMPMAKEGMEADCYGKFPNTEDIIRKPDDVARPFPAKYGLDAARVSELLACVADICSGSGFGTTPVRIMAPEGEKTPIQFMAEGPAVETAYKDQQRAEQQLGEGQHDMAVGHVKVTAVVMPIALA